MGLAVRDQRDIDGEVGAPVDELLGAVQGIDEEEAGGQLGGAVARLLLGDHADGGAKLLQRREDHRLGLAVGLRHRARIGFELHRGAFAVMAHDGRAGAGGGIDEGRGEGAIVEPVRGRRCCVSWGGQGSMLATDSAVAGQMR